MSIGPRPAMSAGLRAQSARAAFYFPRPASTIARVRYDVAVIGAGHNGLVAAAYLARAGRRVVVLERRERVGGACVTEELWPGFRISRAAYVAGLLRPAVARELGLARHGLRLLPRIAVFVHAAAGWARTAPRGRRAARRATRSRRSRAATPSATPSTRRSSTAIARWLEPMLDAPPPDPARLRARDLRAARGAVRARVAAARRALARARAPARAGAARARALVRERAAARHARDRRGDRRLGVALVAGHGLRALPPRDGRDRRRARGLGLRRGRDGPALRGDRRGGARGGRGDPARLAGRADRGVATARRAAWCSRTGRRSRRRSWSRAPTRARRCSAGWAPSDLPDDLRRDVARLDFRSGSVKINLALDRLPAFRGRTAAGPGPEHRGTIHVGAGDLDALDAAFEAARAGRVPERPLVELTLPSALDASLAPPGRHVASLFVQWVPCEAPAERLARAARRDRRARVRAGRGGRAGLHREHPAPRGARAARPRAAVRTHGRKPLPRRDDARPARAAAPAAGLGALCRRRSAASGSAAPGTHPGGGVMGACGRNAAREILRATCVKRVPRGRSRLVDVLRAGRGSPRPAPRSRRASDRASRSSRSRGPRPRRAGGGSRSCASSRGSARRGRRGSP